LLAVINEVDEALRALMKREVADGADVEIVFDAPTRAWASNRHKPTIDLYLYDIREDLQRRQVGVVERRNDQGIVEERQDLPRFYKLAYMITAWAQRPEDEHRLLSAVLACCTIHEAVPVDLMPPLLSEFGVPLRLQMADSSPENRRVSDVWSSLGGDLKASVDLVVTLPIRPSTFYEVAKAVMEPLRLRTFGQQTIETDDGIRQLRGVDGEVEPAPKAGPGAADDGARRKPKAPGSRTG
jgi:hypothetical protein